MGFFTAAAIAIGVSAVIAGASAFMQSRAQKQQAEYQAAVARNNAIIAKQNAKDATKRAGIAADENRRRTLAAIGATRAGSAGAGLIVDVEGSTPALLVEDMAIAGELDTRRILANGEREARRARIQGVNFEAEAGLFDLQADQQRPGVSGLLAGVGTAAQGVSSLALSS